jgi:1-acyl-sn-glycerol-3-phosphate acyltransferase
MSGLDLPRLKRIRIPPNPIIQRIIAWCFLWPNYTFLPGVEIVYENVPDDIDEPFLMAMNHTDRYNYFPFLVKWYMDTGRYPAAWAKGKYYENPIMGAMLERMGTLPVVSRGYLIVRDFLDVTGRQPDEEEYRLLRHWVEKGGGLAREQSDTFRPDPGRVDERVLTKPRNILGRDFDPTRQSWCEAINALFADMMTRFMELHEETFDRGRDLLIFPEGTRSIRIAAARPGIGQLALYTRRPILPVGCSGSDKLHPGYNPFAKKGRVVYRFAAPIPYEELAPFHIDEPFIPFTVDAERRYGDKFQAVADLVMDRINECVEPAYQRLEEVDTVIEKGARRFI